MTTSIKDCHVVIVDDDPFQLKLLSHVLTALGVDRAGIHAFSSGGEALTYLRTHQDGALFVMLDLNMPEMDGVEVVRQLVEIQYVGALVLVSGEDKRILETASKLAAARHLNVLGHLDKPVQREMLEALLRKWCSHPDAAPAMLRKAYAPGEVQRAIEQKELFNVYQPKVEVATGALLGVETLVRWRHPEDGLVFPDQFIGTAEEHGLIDGLTRVVLTEALTQARQWHEAGLRLRVAVNVSMDNLTRLDFADFVVNEVIRSGVSVTELILEVTESRLMKDTLAPLDILTRLRLKHISLSIDDFGTGHSSLAQLRDMPFDELKIDRSFVHGASKDATIRSIFEGSLLIARQLGMKVVAEGVEDEDDWHFLHAQGCDLAQGYFVAKPMPPEELRPWIMEWEARHQKVGRP